MEVAFSPKEVRERLDIESSTLRKYAEILERAGYRFPKNERGHRAYRDRDIIALRKFMEMKNKNAMTLEESAAAVMTWFSAEDMAIGDTTETGDLVPQERSASDMEALRLLFLQQGQVIEKQSEIIARQTEALEQLARRLEEQGKAMQQRDTKIMNAIQTIQDTQEAQKQIAAAQGKESVWKRLFKRP